MNTKHEYERAQIFFRRGIIVHASTNSYFTNGLILEISEKHIVIKDRKDGKDKFILFEELKKSLEPTKERRE